MPQPHLVVEPWVLTGLSCLTIPGALLLGAATPRAGSARQMNRPTTTISVVAGLLLLTLVGADLVPDAVEESTALGSPLLLVALPAVLVFAVASAVLWRPSTALGCCSRTTGLVTAAALAGHGILEGFVVGVGVGVGLATAVGVIALVAGHRFAEGFALGTALGSASRLARGALLAVAALAPLAGGAVGLLAAPGPGLSVLVTAALAGLLGAAGVRLLAGLPQPISQPISQLSTQPTTAAPSMALT